MVGSVHTETVISVVQAAQRLGVNAARVRAMIAAGQLDAHKLGGRWAVSLSSVERRLESGSRPGRNLSPRRAWGLLVLASGQRPHWLSASELSRLRSWLRPERFTELLPRLTKRAVLHRLRAHPSDLGRLSQEVVLGGTSATEAYDLDLARPTESLDAYVRARRLAELRKRFALQVTARPNVVLRAVEEPWPFEDGARVAPIAAVAVDLLESEDARARRAGREIFRKLAR